MPESVLVDQNGNPLVRENLRQEQTAELAWLHTTIAGHPTRGLTPERLARILEDAELGNLIAQMELFEDMEEKDAHLLAEITKRKRALLTLSYSVVPPKNPTAEEKSLAAEIGELVEDLPDFEMLLFNMLDAMGKAFSRIEMPWHQVENMWMPREFNFRQPYWFQVNPLDRDQITLRDGTYTGAALQPFGWISHNHVAKSGYVARGGLYRCLVWPWMFKNMAFRDLAEFLEIYGIPPRIGKYPAGASDKEKRTLLRAVTQLGHNAAGIIPQSMTLDFMEMATGQAEPFELMMSRCDAIMSKAILGGTLTSQTDGVGSQALGNVHNEVRMDLRNADARQLAATLNRDLIWPMVVLNAGKPVDPRRMPRLEFDTRDPEDMKLYATAIPPLVSAGFKIGTAWLYEKLCIPVPQEGEDVLTPPAAALPNAGILRAMLRSQVKAGDEIDGLTDSMDEDWERVMTPVRDQLQAVLAECKSLDEARARLDELAAVLDIEELQKIVANGAFVARYFGRANKG